MNKYIRYTLSIIFIIVLILVFSPLATMLYVRIFGHAGSGIASINIGKIAEGIVGFLVSYTFFVPLTFVIFFKKPEKYYAIFAFIGFELFFMLSSISVLIIFIPIAVIGWLIGEGMLRLYNLYKKK